MTDQTEPMPEPQWGEPPVADPEWDQSYPLERRPQALDGDSPLANHVYTVSFTPKGQPMIVVRANTAAGLTACFEEMDAEGLYTQLAGAQQQLLGSAPPAETVMRQLGATPIPPQQYAPQQPMGQQAQAYPPPQNGFSGPPVPSPGQPPFGAPPGGYQMPQPGWGGGGNQPPARPQGWFAVKIPFNQKEAGDQVKNQLKAQNLYSGNVKWEGDTKTWLVSPAVVQWFAQWNPIPA